MTERSEWTLLVYVGAVNSLAFTTDDVLRWLGDVDLPAGVNFVFELAAPQGSVRGRVVRGGSGGPLEVEVLGKAPWSNSAAPAAVTAFVDWGTATFPSRYTALVLKDHGGGLDLPPGWDGYSGDERPYRILYDDQAKAYLSNPGLRAVLERSRLGRVDILAFDACEMNVLEILYELRNVASFAVATALPLAENPSAFPYRQVMETLGASPSMGPRSLASRMATASKRAALVATELSFMSQVRVCLDQLAGGLVQQVGSETWKKIPGARADLGSSELVDVKALLDRLALVDPGGDVGKLVKGAQAAVSRARLAAGPLPKEQGDPTDGTAIFYPVPPGSPYWAMYGSLSFARECEWTTFLVKACFST